MQAFLAAGSAAATLLLVNRGGELTQFQVLAWNQHVGLRAFEYPFLLVIGVRPAPAQPTAEELEYSSNTLGIFKHRFRVS